LSGRQVIISAVEIGYDFAAIRVNRLTGCCKNISHFFRTSWSSERTTRRDETAFDGRQEMRRTTIKGGKEEEEEAKMGN